MIVSVVMIMWNQIKKNTDCVQVDYLLKIAGKVMGCILSVTDCTSIIVNFTKVLTFKNKKVDVRPSKEKKYLYISCVLEGKASLIYYLSEGHRKKVVCYWLCKSVIVNLKLKTIFGAILWMGNKCTCEHIYFGIVNWRICLV